jgi:hypothetical protein
MAEQEVIKHTKAVYKIWNNGQHSTWQKIKEFVIEIAIIVFAVSVSIWLHGISEHNHQQKEVKTFLLSLRRDLLSDTKEMREDIASYNEQKKAFRYVLNAKPGIVLEKDSVRLYKRWFFNTTKLQQNNGRFEGFKSSGKIGNIEDEVLQNDIMDLYQENIPSLLTSTDAYIYRKNQLIDFDIRNRKRMNDTTNNLAEILVTPEALNICAILAYPDEIIGRYVLCIEKMEAIIRKIEKQYPSIRR